MYLSAIPSHRVGAEFGEIIYLNYVVHVAPRRLTQDLYTHEDTETETDTHIHTQTNITVTSLFVPLAMICFSDIP